MVRVPAPAGAAAAALRAHLLGAVAERPVAATRAVLVADALAAAAATVTATVTTGVGAGAGVGAGVGAPAAVAVASAGGGGGAAAAAAAACLRGLVASGQLREGLGGTYLLAWGGCVRGGVVVKVEPT